MLQKFRIRSMNEVEADLKFQTILKSSFSDTVEKVWIKNVRSALMKRLIGKLLFSAFSLSLFLLTFSNGAAAQDLDDVTISGRVTDTNGAAIVGATVTATQIEKNLERTFVTNEEGRYRIVELQPGTYKVRATASGFGAKEQIDLITIAGQNLQLDFTLAPAGVQAEQTVTIGGDDAPAVDTTRTVVGGTVTQREVEELPNNTRNPLDLVFTLGGVTEEPLSTRDLADERGSRTDTTGPRTTPEEAGIFALSGGAAYSNNITIDGFDNNDDRAATFRFQPSIESIDEVQVITNQFSAEYGRASGGRVNIRTRAGSNRLRGRIYYFFADESLNANGWRNNFRGVSRPPYQRNIPGFTLGGPLPFGYFKNRTFFFTALEYDDVYDTAQTDTYVPIGQNPRFALPAPTTGERITDFGATLGRYIVETTTPRRNTIFTARIDHNFTDTQTMTVSYQLGRLRDKRIFYGGNSLPEALLGRRRDTDAINLAFNSVFNANTVNQFRFQYSVLEPNFVASGQEANPVVLISFREPGRTSNTTLTAGSSTLGASERRERRLQFQDTFSYVAGGHSLRFGGDIQRVNSTFIDLSDASGTYNFGNPISSTTVTQCRNAQNQVLQGGVNAFLANCVVRYRHNFFTDSTQKNTYYGIFAQDEWRALNNLTLSFGARYERETIIDDKNNWGPRFAVAWDPFKKGKGVVRFGAGVFYNRVLLRTIDDFRRSENEIEFDTNRVPTTGGARDSYLQQLSNLFPNRLTPDDPLVRRYISEGFNRLSFFRRLDPNIEVPESYQFNLGFEREIGNGFVFEANATYNKTVRLWREFNANAPDPRRAGNFSTLTEALINCTNPAVCQWLNTSIRFERAGTSAPNERPAGNLIFVNLDSLSGSTAASSPYGRARDAARFLRPVDPNLGQIEQVASIGNALYRGLILELRRRYRKIGFGFGTSFRAVYTLSKLEDDGVVNTSSAQVVGDFEAEFSRSLLDRRHRFAFSGVFDTPSWLGKLRFSPVLRLASGAPFNISNGGDDQDDRNLDDVNTDRPNFSGSFEDLRWRLDTDPINPALLTAFSLPPLGTPGNLPRNAGQGPGQFIFDLNVSRVFKFTERMSLRPSLEIDNVFNATVFSFGSEFINATSASAITLIPSDFLVPRRTLRPRQIRLGLRFDF
jgi:hypothetical protein